MSQRASLPVTVQYLGVRLTVSCSDPRDLYHQPKDFYPQDKEGGVLIGRAASSDLQLTGNGVANVHCRIERAGDAFFVEDAGSQTGTMLSGRLLRAGERMQLRENDTLHIGPYSIVFRLGLSSFINEPAVSAAPLASTMQLNREVAGSLLNDPSEQPPQLRVLDGQYRGQSFELQEYQHFAIGREPTCQLCLSDDAMSRVHALIRRDWSGVTIIDQNSRNGVLVNGQRIVPGAETNLSHGDKISLGVTTLLYHDPFAASLEEQLKGVAVDGGDLIDGETILPSQAMALIKQTDPKDVGNPAPEVATNPVESPLTPVAKQIDIREPVSGKWRVPKKQTNAETPPAQQPVEASPKPSAVAATPASKPSEARRPSQSNLPASPPTKAPPPAKVHSETALPAAERTMAKPKQKQNILMAVVALLGVMLVVLLALVLAFLL